MRRIRTIHSSENIVPKVAKTLRDMEKVPNFSASVENLYGPWDKTRIHGECVK